MDTTELIPDYKTIVLDKEIADRNETHLRRRRQDMYRLLRDRVGIEAESNDVEHDSADDGSDMDVSEDSRL